MAKKKTRKVVDVKKAAAHDVEVPEVTSRFSHAKRKARLLGEGQPLTKDALLTYDFKNPEVPSDGQPAQAEEPSFKNLWKSRNPDRRWPSHFDWVHAPGS
jgi:hypothetical protein